MQKSEDKSSVSLYTDGASRGNPGESGIGFIIKKTEKHLSKDVTIQANAQIILQSI